MKSYRVARCFLLVATVTMATSASAVEFLSQNWSAQTRQFYYTTSQGSRLLPYDWFLALEVSDAEDSFLAKRIPELGYLANPNTDNNPDRLPVGFVADTDAGGNTHLGLNCAACHTNQISYEGKTYQIDGGPSLADIWGLLSGIGDSLNATRKDEAKFSRFADKVLGENHSRDEVAALRNEFASFLKYWNDFIKASEVPHEWGRGRLDAFGMIFNRVSAIDLDMPENNRKPDAPVSYPFLWGTSWEDKVQWNGSAPNTNDIERLGRNIGEVLGVFAQTDLSASLFKPYYRTSARRLNQVRLENKLKKLWSPQWPDEFPKLDDGKRIAGEALFTQHCVSCHQVVPHGQQDTPVNVVMTPLHKAGTDPRMAKNAAIGTVLTGRLEGARIPGLDPLPAEVPRGVLVRNVGRGALFSPFLDVPVQQEEDRLGLSGFRSRLRAVNDQVISDEDIIAFLHELDLTKEEVGAFAAKYEQKIEGYYNDLKEVREAIRTGNLSSLGEEDDGLKALAYKARPLDGIWATAPYLHNGSVPNLYELLLPADKRSPTFHVGSDKFDPVHVGFDTQQTNGTTLFDTTLPGNSNEGHDTYGDFTESQRWQLVEYMKSL